MGNWYTLYMYDRNAEDPFSSSSDEPLVDSTYPSRSPSTAADGNQDWFLGSDAPDANPGGAAIEVADVTLPVPETQHEPASPAASTTSTLILENDEDEATATSVQDDSVRATDSGNTNADTAAPSPIPRGRVADPIPRRRSKRAKNPTKRAVESRLQSRKRPRALRMMQSDDSFCALPDESKATILLMQDKGFTRGYIGVGKESGSAREQPPGAQRGFPEDGDGLARGGPRFVQEFVRRGQVAETKCARPRC
ncbi:hypothetical protein PF007_g31248 [Phytophthora fragariae]|uniref:Uncharacterized protein n=1 Tax=Phytophthora fragariae TaxID=53985 RepID=A0A6A3PLJ2_9STRA|nr:hypothetical protein PF007_g31248 [Phytophthora fragariae]KAE9059603.1 hypothetical protein PF006_g31844 [Phytophthora fragariae]